MLKPAADASGYTTWSCQAIDFSVFYLAHAGFDRDEGRKEKGEWESEIEFKEIVAACLAAYMYA